MWSKTVIFPLFLLACNRDDAADSAAPTPTVVDSGSADSGSADTADTGTSSSSLPAQPDPFTLTVSGAYTGSLTFDTPTCTQPLGSKNFSIFWRNSNKEHVFVLVAQMLGTFAGAGTYDGTAVTVKLQEEAGGEGNYFLSSDGDTISMVLEGVEEQEAWGEFSFSGLEDGALVASPMPVPIWCDSLN